MTLPINYASNATIANTDIISWTAVINALVELVAVPEPTIVAGYTTTVSSGSTLTLTVSSTTMQVITGTSTQLVTLPTTTVVQGAVWIISNQTNQTTTVQSSGANTVNTVTAGDCIMFTSNQATPTTAAHWSYTTCPQFPAFATTVTAAGTTTLVVASPQAQIFTGSSTQTVLLPTTLVPAGAQWSVINQSTGLVTVQSSGANTVTILAAGTSAVFTAVVATPTTAANWSSQYGGVSVASGTVLTGPSVSGQIVAPPAAVATLVAPVADIAVGATATKVLASNVIPANTLAAGSAFRIQAFGTQSAATSSLTYTMYIGTSGTTGDTVVGSATSTIAASIGAAFEGVVTIRTTGAPGTCIGSARLSCGAAGGNSIVAAAISQPSTTVANYITLGMATSTQTHTVQTAVITWAGA